MTMRGEVFVVTGSGLGHFYPSIELCNHLTQRHYRTTLILSSALTALIPSSFTHNPLVTIALIPPSPRPMPGSDPLNHPAAQAIDTHLANRLRIEDLPPPLCAIVDFQMGWTKRVFWKFEIPVIGFFTFGASAAAMEWGSWKVQAAEVMPGETRVIPGLPEEMAITHSDLKRKPFPTGSNPNRGGGEPPKPGDRPPWVPEIEGSIALMFNTCDDLDGPFMKYMKEQMGVPAWGVGPLLHRREPSGTAAEVIQWLDSKPRGSVLYVAFGSEVGPTREENEQLANALEISTRPFIWVIKENSDRPETGELRKKAGERGMIICGWAPQMLILSHESTGGFLSHCGWNSTMEGIGSGVPFLAWPIRGDQYFNAKYVVEYMGLGYRVANDLSEMVSKDDIVKGIEKVMGDEGMHKRAVAMKSKLEHGTSEVAFDAFGVFFSRPQSGYK